MLRKLIALLVLLTGLAAFGQPAQARIVDLDSARLTSLATGYACAEKPSTRTMQLGIRQDLADTPQKACPRPPRIVLIVPTVMLQADRARE
jgi:hypothetical protein